jgi:hypothetical protein
MEFQFSSFNQSSNLGFLAAKSPEELQAKVTSLKCRTSIVAIYFDGSQHIAWLQTNFPIKKGIENGKRKSS